MLIITVSFDKNVLYYNKLLTNRWFSIKTFLMAKTKVFLSLQYNIILNFGNLAEEAM